MITKRQFTITVIPEDNNHYTVQITPENYQVGDGYDTTYPNWQSAMSSLAEDLEYYLLENNQLKNDN